MRKKFNTKRILFVIIASFVIFNSSIVLIAVIFDFPVENNVLESLDKIKIYSKKDKSFYSVLPREEAIKFALNQTSTLIRYVFAGATGLLAFIIKIIIDPFRDNEMRIPPTSSIVLAFCAAGLCLSSLLMGICAQGYFPRMATNNEFSLIGSFGNFVLFQYLTLFAGGIILLLSIVPYIGSKK